MKKIKFKRKSKRIFFSTRFIVFILIIIIFSTSSAYALLRQDINIVGNVSGQAVFTYYFEKPDTWRGNYMHAHIWQNGGETTTWPGLAMQQVSGSIYKIEITPDMPFYSTHDYIIFNDKVDINDSSGYQTSDLALNRFANNNQIFSIQSYNTPGKTRIFVKIPSGWEKTIYAYTWNSSGSNAAWPGIEITANRLSADGYFVEVDNTYTMIIFNDGIHQTADLTIPSQQDMTCTAGNSTWSKYYTYGTWRDYITPVTLFPSHSHS